MTTLLEASRLALEALELFERAGLATLKTIEAITSLRQAIEQAQKQETETCMGCNGNGVVGNILDTDTCPFCKGSGVEQAQKQEPVAWIEHHKAGDNLVWDEPHKGTPLYTSPPQRQPLTHEQRVNLRIAFEPHKLKWNAQSILIDMVEAAHGITGEQK